MRVAWTGQEFRERSIDIELGKGSLDSGLAMKAGGEDSPKQSGRTVGAEASRVHWADGFFSII